MIGELLARDQHLAARLVDMGVDRQVVLGGKLGAALQHRGRAALRRERRQRPVQRAAGGMPAELVLEIVELVADRTAGGAEHLLHVGRQVVLVPHHRDRRHVPYHGREHHAQPDLAVGVDHDVGVGVVERDQPQHVLHAGDAAADRLQRADQRARPHLLPAAVGAQRQRVEQPHFQRQLLEQAAAERVVGMVVRVDEAGDDELAARVDHLRVAGVELALRPRRCRLHRSRMSATFGLWTSPSWS